MKEYNDAKNKYVEEVKILNLIDRMCNGESINANQFDDIYKFIERKGHSSTLELESHIPIWNDLNSIIGYDDEIRPRKGVRYLGLFATSEYSAPTIYFGDTRKYRIAYIRKYSNGLIRG